MNRAPARARVTIGTRGSPLARWQASHVAECLMRFHPELAVEQHVIRTEGDVASAKGSGPATPEHTGVFVRRIEQALLAGEVDLAVHSLKDMPTDQPDGLTIAAVLERHDARDALISREGWTLDRLPRGTLVGTGSFRRRCQLLHHRPDVQVVPVRGNVETRMRKLRDGEVGALVLAVAGIERLALDDLPFQRLPAKLCLPAVGQGALALECRTSDRECAGLVAPLNHDASMTRVRAERAFLRRLGGGCLAPATAFATIANDRLLVEGCVRIGPAMGATSARMAEGPRVAARRRHGNWWRRIAHTGS